PPALHTLSLHDALPTSTACAQSPACAPRAPPYSEATSRKERMARKTPRADEQAALAHPEDRRDASRRVRIEVMFDQEAVLGALRSEEHTSELQSRENLV